jgi:SAM-dependent methyltransferase
MSALAHRLKDRFFRAEHPYRTFKRTVDLRLPPQATLLDAGCGRTAPILASYRGRAARLIGVDMVEFDVHDASGLELYRADLAAIPVEDASVDVVMARSVMEHVIDPGSVYAEVCRVLKPGGHFVFLTANLWDYASLVARVVPNRLHPWIVSRTEGRAEHDVFPIAYKSNTRRAVERWAGIAGLEVLEIDYLGQYPAYFMFNGFLFLVATGYEKILERVNALAFLRGWILATLRKPE